MPTASSLTRSLTGHHVLRPATRSNSNISFAQAHNIPTYTQMLAWTFGRGSVIRRIWPAVLFHTLFAVAIVSLTLGTPFEMAIPGVIMNVLGVVLGFVISYRAVTGYNLYYMGRTSWSDITKNCRALGRLIWFHVPPRLKPATAEEKDSGHPGPSEEEMTGVMTEKKVALNLIEGFATAVKHHLREEAGIYFEDLYDLVEPLWHEHDQRPSVLNTAARTPPPVQFTVTSPNQTTRPFNFEPISVHTSPISPILRRISQFPSRPDTTPITVNGGITEPGPQSPQKWTPNAPGKRRPRIAGGGQNLPLEILGCLSEWVSVLEDRGTVPGTTMGGILGCLASFEENLTTLEKILTTPLPYAFSVHINTVWIYLFFLPFQLVEKFAWYSIPGVLIASFIYLGFIAAGEELEQPFGYDANDLDLDLFCRQIIHADIAQLKKTPCRNAYFPPAEHLSIKGRMLSISSIEDGLDEPE